MVNATSLSIHLNDVESIIANKMEWDFTKIRDSKKFRENGDYTLELFRALTLRNAIPQHRLAYFTKSEYNVGGRGKSRKMQFEKNGCRGADIITHCHFLPFFRYMVFGPQLSQATIDLMSAACEPRCFVDRMELRSLTRAQMRTYANNSNLPEEFYRLGLDLLGSIDLADTMRRAAKDAART